LRRNRAGLKRIGVLALAMLIALGALGTAYAAWTDSIYVQGTVNTGTLDIDVAGVSSTFVYKVPGNPPEPPSNLPEIVVHYVFGQTDPEPPAGGALIARAVTVPDTSTDSDLAYMTLAGLFPGVDFWADVELEYLGSIPATISMAEIHAIDDPGNKLDSLWTLGRDTKDPLVYPVRYGAWIDGEIKPDGSSTWAYVDDPLGLELQQFDMVHIALHVRLPEGPEYENLSLEFAGTITVIQYNEYAP